MLLNTNHLMVNSPLEQFEVTNFIGINAPILGYLNITLTNLGLYSLLVLFLIIGICLLTYTVKPVRLQRIIGSPCLKSRQLAVDTDTVSSHAEYYLQV